MDTYPYELLDGRRFQQLVQSLLVRQYPGIQCMPVVGPDGGRDAIEMRESEGAQDSKLTDAAIFQVKFREPQVLGTPETDDLFHWLTAAITRESTKIARLEERGAREYILITNIPATGHLDTGLRDRVQRYLDTEIDIPARCWWREDLDARLASRFDLVVHFGLLKALKRSELFWKASLAAEMRTTSAAQYLAPLGILPLLPCWHFSMPSIARMIDSASSKQIFPLRRYSTFS